MRGQREKRIKLSPFWFPPLAYSLWLSQKTPAEEVVAGRVLAIQVIFMVVLFPWDRSEAEGLLVIYFIHFSVEDPSDKS